MDITLDTTTEVLDSLAGTPDPRTQEILRAVVLHLHDLVREVRPTLAEWEAAIEFLTATGQKCDATRQEYILLSDVLGVSMLVETINGQEVGTESTVLGPFHVVESPPRDLGADIDLLGGAVPCVVTGSVADEDGTPRPGAAVDVWQCTEDGFYDVQQPERQPLGNGRGLFHADEQGAFWFRTVTPGHYPIPTDGPVGRLLAATHRHPYRPAHIHFVVDAPGCRSLTTHIFVADSPYLESDAVFAVKQSLVEEFPTVHDADLARRWGVTVPFRHVHVDLVLQREPGR